MYTPIIIKKNYFLSSQRTRMSGNSMNFDDKKIEKATSKSEFWKYIYIYIYIYIHIYNIHKFKF